MTNERGITILETVLYIGLFAVIIPAATVFFLQFAQTNDLSARRAQMEQAAGMTISHMNTELARANAWNITGSTLGSVNSVFVYTNHVGESVTIERALDTVDFDGTPQTVGRLRTLVGADPAEWITPPQINVVVFQLDEVENSLGATAGLNIALELFMLNPSGGPFRGAEFASQITFALRPATIVL